MIADPKQHSILVIDDDPGNLAVVRDCLVESGYAVLIAEDGESALQRAVYVRPDLILLDIMMPGMDGFETCRRLKALPATREIPVIFMTALAETGHKVKGLEAGAVDYITKPFQREELLARVAVHLQNRELTKRLRESKESLESRVRERTAELALTIQALHEEIFERERGDKERLRLAAAIEQAGEAIFMTDADWDITYVNPAFERLNGYGREEIVGRNCSILRRNQHDPEFYRKMRENLGRDKVWSGRLTMKRKDGSLYEADTTISEFRDGRDTVLNYISIQRDITHELQLERELRQSQKMEAIGTLAGGIAHDFNNILTVIIGFTELAQKKLEDDHSATPYLSQVQEAGARARDLVKRILTFSRRGDQERRPVRLTPIVLEVFKLLRSTLPSTVEIHRHIHTSPDGDTVLADPTQIHQMLMNLGTNAAHAMRTMGGVLGVSLAEVADDAPPAARHPGLGPGPHLLLAVSDTGHGMDAETRERIFEPYFTTKKVGEGTGIGLAVVQGIVKNHGGAISVDSEPGKGTTFHIFLPKYSGDTVFFEPISSRIPAGGSERILFIDDEAILAKLGKAQLESLGYAVTAALNSREALELFRAKPQFFDLVITDMTMPGLTGKELAGEFLAMRPDIPIILCTGFSEQINERKAKSIGVKAFLMKPYTMDNLNKVIRRILTGNQSRLHSRGSVSG